MMIRLLILILLFFTLAACKSTPYLNKHEYVLSAGNPVKHYQTTKKSLSVTDTVTRSLYYNNEFQYRLKDNRLKHDFYNSFAVIPTQLITYNTTQWFKNTKLFSHVFTSNLGLNTDYVLKSRLISLEADYRKPNHPIARMEIEYVLLNSYDKVLLDKHYVANQPLTDKSTTALVHGWNSSLRKILSSVALDVEGKIKVI